MPKKSDKLRISRLRVLDELLSEDGQGYSIQQLVEKVNNHFKEDFDKSEEISYDIINRDIHFMKNDLDMDIIYSEPVKTVSNQRAVRLCRYRDENTSLFKISLNDEEKEILRIGIELLGGLKGVGKKVEKFRTMLGNNNSSVISSTKNPKEDVWSSLIWSLYRNITSHEVLSIKMRNRSTGNIKRHIVHPWYLREYNRRWYMFGFDESVEKIAHFALDRMSGTPSVIKGTKWKAPKMSIENILKDVIGVSINDNEVQEILFWVSNKSADFVKKKPIHHTQREKKVEKIGENTNIQRFKDGKFFTIKCKKNYELVRELMSFGSELIVLYPNNIVDEIKQKLTGMAILYNH